MNKMIRGFTLIELMIVIGILAIVITIGYPAYRDQVMKSRRAEGMGELLELADRMERFYSGNGTYAGATLGPDADDVYETSTEKGNYTLGITAQTATLFTITADPTGPQDKDKCGMFTMTSTGQKSAEGGNKCWKI
ncbi:MAG: type IV pilin protein [Pseudomonadota bacterium]